MSNCRSVEKQDISSRMCAMTPLGSCMHNTNKTGLLGKHLHRVPLTKECEIYVKLVGREQFVYFCFLSFSMMWTKMTADTMMIRPTENTTVFTRHTEIPAERLSGSGTRQNRFLHYKTDTPHCDTTRRGGSNRSVIPVWVEFCRLFCSTVHCKVRLRFTDCPYALCIEEQHDDSFMLIHDIVVSKYMANL